MALHIEMSNLSENLSKVKGSVKRPGDDCDFLGSRCDLLPEALKSDCMWT